MPAPHRSVPSPAPDTSENLDDAPSFARISLVVYALLIVYASWFPFSGWRDMGLSPFAYLFARFPYYWTLFDVLTNVAGYAPLGLFAIYSLYPRVRGIPALLLVVLGGFALSAIMEAVQTYLPTRVSSNLDLLTNTAGCLVGALIGVWSCRAVRESRLLALRQRWFHRDASPGLLIIALWPLAQIYPQSQVFGLGQIVGALSGLLSSLLDQPFDLSSLWLNGVHPSAEQYWLADLVVTACGMIGGALMFMLLLRKNAPRAVMAIVLTVSMVAMKSLANALIFTPEQAFSWLTPGAVGGILIASLMLLALALARHTAQRRVAVLALMISLIVANLMPDNPYFASTLQTWVQGKFLNFNGAAQFLSVLWPFLAFWFLLRSPRQKPHPDTA
ncbi:VanZ family protein [Herbaspirillum sp. RTI4]|uniref:VanZ family protein n=1 Tax=Herbaspirillum sp. RTI4 TaxID=3048640 RepID=UPI002AB595A4|nr:VanZ family protein [Herbaspirillum sp. RTI4]MDY7576944.1 VanZ family protein [Herbaspirillum sp. RTI4]MEA9982154.1 VanZ family protein [Herbaspirillum sp. RTI4]